ncbi:MAG: DUF4912 domain-containing protein [Treponema sp.]|nr:DUF4912 domain-containing protein [Treponema sp.]
MNENSITRSYLETLSFNDLVALADEYGVDVPEDLDRRFLIAELMELALEESGQNEEMIISSENGEGGSALPGNYNETQVSCVFRNPAWLFVFWNINENDAASLKNDEGELKLRICFLKNPKEMIPEEAFEIQASTSNQEQYVLISAEKKFLKVELIYSGAGAGKVLAFSPVVTIPHGSDLVNEMQPGSYDSIDPVLKLSGMETTLAEQYRKHRHSFS